MKILVFGFTGTIGGTETAFMQYYRGLVGQEYIFDFVTFYENMAFEDEIKQKGGVIFKVSSPKRNPIKYKSQVSEIINDGGYDCVYVNMLSAANIVPLEMAKKNKVHVIVAHSHNNDTPRGLVRKLCHYVNKKKISRLATVKAACSIKAGRWMFGNDAHFVVLDNLIDKQLFEYDKRNKQLFRDGKKDYVVGHVGRFCEQKNQNFILDLAKDIQSIDSTIKFVMIGKDSSKYGAKQRIEKEHIKNVTIVDGMKEIYRAYSGFDLFILPSTFEGFGIVGVEAQCNGLECLISDRVPRELNITGDCKYLNIDDFDAWEKEILGKPMRHEKVFFAHEKNLLSKENIEKIIPIIRGEQ